MVSTMIHTIQNLLKKSNTGTILFFLMNFGFLYLIYGSAGGVSGFLHLIFLYAFSLLLSFSPIGQWFLCQLNGAKRMARMDMRHKILPIAAEVYQKAKRKTPQLPNRINIRIMYDPNPNAFAIGTNTICVTEGLLELPEHQIAGILAHEIGHLALQHTVIQILIGGGNLIISGIIVTLELCQYILQSISAVSMLRYRRSVSWVMSFLSIISVGLVFGWTKLCMLFLMSSSRSNEFEADKYAFEIGYGEELAEALDLLTLGTPQASMLKLLCSSHPLPGDRVGALQRMGVPYSRY